MKWLFLFPLILWGCLNLNDCRQEDCFTPPPDIYFELVDSASGENLFQNGTLPESPIVITNENNATMGSTLFKDGGAWTIRSTELGWKFGSHTYTLSVGDTLAVNFTLEMETIETKCCTFVNIKDFKTDNYSFSGFPDAGYIRVLIPVSGSRKKSSDNKSI
jgi:hypothetical protein